MSRDQLRRAYGICEQLRQGRYPKGKGMVMHGEDDLTACVRVQAVRFSRG